MNTDVPGRGKKQCASCQKYIGVRNLVCPNCKQQFAPAAIKKKQLTPEIKAQLMPTQTSTAESNIPSMIRADRSVVGSQVSDDFTAKVCIPAGPCPAKLDSFGLEDIKAWVEKIQRVGISRHEIYTDDAICYYAREYAEVFTPEYRALCSNIKNVMGVEVVPAIL